MKKQQKNLYALYIERESKKGSYMEENVEQISINVEKVNKIKSNFHPIGEKNCAYRYRL